MSLLMLDAFEKVYKDNTKKDVTNVPFHVMPATQMAAIRRKVRKQRAVVRGLEAKSITRMLKRLANGIPVTAKDVHTFVDIGLLETKTNGIDEWIVYLNDIDQSSGTRAELTKRLPTAVDTYITRMSA